MLSKCIGNHNEFLKLVNYLKQNTMNSHFSGIFLIRIRLFLIFKQKLWPTLSPCASTHVLSVARADSSAFHTKKADSAPLARSRSWRPAAEQGAAAGGQGGSSKAGRCALVNPFGTQPDPVPPTCSSKMRRHTELSLRLQLHIQ